MKYYSQNGQDIYLDNLFRQQEEGFFIEIGAYDGIKYSNTYFLEKHRNWTGICVEANENIYNALKNNRSCTTLNCCISSNEEKSKYLKISGSSDMLSGLIANFHPNHMDRIKKEVETKGGDYVLDEVTSSSFNKIMARYIPNGHVDYCSIDTEGSELSILKGIDFKNITISVFSIENTYKDENIYRLMRENSYLYVQRIGEDDFFISEKSL